MNITKTFILFPLTALSLFISACSNDKAPATEKTKIETTQTTEVKESATQGNWQTKAAELSFNTTADIQADLAALNQITNSMNSRAVALRNEIEALAKDPTQIAETFKKANQLQEQVKTEIMALNLKSAEVQKVRTDMIDNLMTANQLYTLSTAADFNPAAPSQAFQQLTQRSIAIEQKVSTELDALNQKYLK